MKVYYISLVLIVFAMWGGIFYIFEFDEEKRKNSLCKF